MKKLTTAQEITSEIAKLQYSPSFQIHSLDFQINFKKGAYEILFNINYENTNSQNEFTRTFKVEHSSPSFHQTKIRCERLLHHIESKTPITIGVA